MCPLTALKPAGVGSRMHLLRPASPAPSPFRGEELRVPWAWSFQPRLQELADSRLGFWTVLASNFPCDPDRSFSRGLRVSHLQNVRALGQNGHPENVVAGGASAAPGSSLEMQLLRPLPGSTESETPGVGRPAICFNTPPGDPRLKTTALADICSGHPEECSRPLPRGTASHSCCREHPQKTALLSQPSRPWPGLKKAACGKSRLLPGHPIVGGGST